MEIPRPIASGKILCSMPSTKKTNQPIQGPATRGDTEQSMGDENVGTIFAGHNKRLQILELLCLLTVFFVAAGDPAPMVNESHYLVKAKNFWNPNWCANDAFVSSGKAHITFYITFGWLTKFFSLETTAWIGRLLGWSVIALGLSNLCRNLFNRPFFSVPVAIIWIAATQHGNLAGEWVIGGIEGKVPAYGFVLLGLAEMVRRNWTRTWILLGIASAFHVLTGGWSVIAALITWRFTERSRNDAVRLFDWPILLGGIIALAGLIPAIALQANSPSADALKASRIYTYYRLAHHLLPANFQFSWYLRHGTLVALTLLTAYRFRHEKSLAPLTLYSLAAFGLAIIGFAIGYVPLWDPDLAAKLLRYYWFRLSDAMIPLLFAVLTVKLYIESRQQLIRHATTSYYSLAVVIASAFLLISDGLNKSTLSIPPAASHRVLGFQQDASISEQQHAFTDWLKVCQWVKHSSDEQEVFLTPRHQQTFKWYAERAEVTNWKDVPQDARSLLTWYETFQEIFPQRLGHVRVTIQYPKLREIRRRFDVRWMIVDRRIVGENLPLVRIYPINSESNPTYAVYELPNASKP